MKWVKASEASKTSPKLVELMKALQEAITHFDSLADELEDAAKKYAAEAESAEKHG